MKIVTLTLLNKALYFVDVNYHLNILLVKNPEKRMSNTTWLRMTDLANCKPGSGDIMPLHRLAHFRMSDHDLLKQYSILFFGTYNKIYGIYTKSPKCPYKIESNSEPGGELMLKVNNTTGDIFIAKLGSSKIWKYSIVMTPVPYKAELFSYTC